jgi:hypothetical protein
VTIFFFFKSPEFWYSHGKILVKKKHTPVGEIENPEFWYGRSKILVKKNYTPGVKKKIQIFFKNFKKNYFFSKVLNFGTVAVKFW